MHGTTTFPRQMFSRKSDLQAIVEALGPIVQEFLAIEREKLEILKRQLPIESKEVPKKPDAPLPSDVLLWCQKWSEKWAREDMEKIAREKYDEYGDWDKVREVLSNYA